MILEQKNPERVAAGLKATLHNPSVSAEAKSRAQARLKEMGVDSADIKAKDSKTADETQSHDLRHEENVEYEMPEEHRILGGYKAALKSSVVLVQNFRDLLLIWK
jgi:Conidiation protein 6